MATDPLVRIPVPAGPAGLEALLAPLQAALRGDGPVIAPLPVVSPTVSEAYIGSLLRAVGLDAPLEDDRTAVVLTTSGSTGNPKGVLLSAEGLTALHPWRDEPAAWVSTLPLTTAGGLNVLIRALAPGSTVVGIDSLGSARPFTPAGFAAGVAHAASEGLPVRTSLVPAQARRLLGDPQGIDALRACATILIGGAGLDPSLRESARTQGISLISTYGMTETGGGCVYDGVPLDGVRVSIDATSRITLGGPSVALGYRLLPQLTAERFTAEGFRTDDLGEMAHGELRIIGRTDDIVTVNGINVSVQAVESLLRSSELVRDCAVIALADEQRGNRIIAFVCGDDLDTQALGESVTEQLGAAARPRSITTIERLPQLAGGKVDRQALIARARENR